MYTINGKEYSEFDINKRCAELLHKDSVVVRSIEGYDLVTVEGGGFAKILIDYCNNPSDTWPIIEKCWDKLIAWVDNFGNTENRNPEKGDVVFSSELCQTRWQYLMYKHRCSKLIAACICFIEANGVRG